MLFLSLLPPQQTGNSLKFLSPCENEDSSGDNSLLPLPKYHLEELVGWGLENSPGKEETEAKKKKKLNGGWKAKGSWECAWAGRVLALDVLNPGFCPQYHINWYMVDHTCNLSTWEVEEEGWGVKGHPPLKSKLEASLGYMTFYGQSGGGIFSIDIPSLKRF